MISGSVSVENRFTRASVSLDSRRKVGKIRIVSASSSFFEAVASKVALEPVIRLRSCASSWVSAPNTTPVFLTSRCTAPSWESSTASTSAPSEAKPGSVPSASLKSRPRPLMPFASSVCQPLKSARVCGSMATSPKNCSPSLGGRLGFGATDVKTASGPNVGSSTPGPNVPAWSGPATNSQNGSKLV